MGEGVSNAQIKEKLLLALTKGVLRCRVSSQSWTFENNAVSVKRLARILASRLEVSSNRVHDCLEDVMHKQCLQAHRALQQAVLKSDAVQADDTELRRWLKLLERDGTDAQTHEANVLAMCQWIWQVKQGVADREARWHVAPIFWSKEHGTGKSYNVLRILKPFENFMRHLAVDDLNDKFNASLFRGTFIAWFDEFAGADRILAATFKAILSGKKFDQRGMHSETGNTVENRVSMIATSNDDPPHGLEDPTGARRLWSVHCSGTNMAGCEDRKRAFDSLDVDAVWSCVRTDDPCPHDVADPALLAYMDEVREQRLRVKSSLENFLEEMCEEDCEAPPMLLKEFREQAVRYAMDTKQVPVKGGYKKFGTILKTLGVHVVSPRNNWYVHNMRLKQFESSG